MSLTGSIAAVAALLGMAGLGGWFKTWLDHKAGKRQQSDNVAMALVEKLEKRVEKLEADLRDERVRCDKELRLVRHSERRGRQMIYSLLHLVSLPEPHREKMLARIREDLATLEMAEAAEKGAALFGQVDEDPE